MYRKGNFKNHVIEYAFKFLSIIETGDDNF